MTVQSQVNKIVYVGDGTTTTFPYTFRIFEDTDLEVILQDTSGVETLQTLNTHYTVTGAGDPNGGNVVFVTAPTSGYKVIIRRTLPLTQLIDYVSNEPFPAEIHEEGLDRLTMIAQQLKEAIDRAILRDSTQTASLILPALVANKFLATDGSKLVWSECVGGGAGIPEILSGLDANKPVIYFLNRFYWATDTYKLYWDNGSSWIDITALFAGFVRLTDDQIIAGIKDFSTAIKLAKTLVRTSGGQIDIKNNADDTVLQTIYDSGFQDLPKQSRCRVYRNGTQSAAGAGADVKILLNEKNYDEQNEFSTTTYRFTATKAGKYLVAGAIYGPTFYLNYWVQIQIKKNSATHAAHSHVPGYSTAPFWLSCADIMDLAVNDFVELFISHSYTTSIDVGGFSWATWLAIHKLS